MVRQAVHYISSVAGKSGNEMLSLTDMWRAAEGNNSQRPNEWLRLPSSDLFLEHIETTTGLSRSELYQSLNESGTWNTWANWQIAMAYAKKE